MSVLRDAFIWERFWAPRGASVASRDGFLVEPTTYFGLNSNPNVLRLEDVAAMSRVIALGEPGMGKSHVLRKQYELLEALRPHQAMWVDLHSVGSPGELDKRVFAHHRVHEWLNGGGDLHLFLDSFDECRIRVEWLPGLINDEVSNWPNERLRLYVGCRSADWPSSLESDLLKQVGEDRITILQLLPLTRSDVLAAAQNAGISEPESFFKEVAKAGVGPLAAKPLTLDLLLSEYLRSGALPSRQSELYERGCELLCEESVRRLDVNLRPILDVPDRLEVASRLGAISIYANRDAYWTGSVGGDMPTGDIPIREVFGGTVTTPRNSRVNLDGDTVRDALASGLFTVWEPDRSSWSHQTFAEYLAARALSSRAITIGTVKTLLYHEDGKVAPQLRATASWLAGMRKDVFQEVLLTDPQVLFRSDTTLATETDRKEWLESLLSQLKAGKLSIRRVDTPELQEKLNHSSIAAQLRPVISSIDTGFEARLFAIHVTEACLLNELEDVLSKVALDPSENTELRVAAVYAINGVGSPPILSSLVPLLHEEPDNRDELLGVALIALWPRYLQADKLLQVLKAPKVPNFYGSYQRFLSSHLVPGFSDEHLPIALAWLTSQLDGDRDRLVFESAARDLTTRAFGLLDDPAIATELANLLAFRLRSHRGIWGPLASTARESLSASGGQKALTLLPWVLDAFGDDARFGAYLLWDHEFIRDEDIPTIAELMVVERDYSAKELYGQILLERLRWGHWSYVDAILEVVHSGDEASHRILAPRFDPIEIDSPEAYRLRADYEKQLKIEREFEENRRAKEETVFDWTQRLEEHVELWESGEIGAWYQILWTLSIHKDGQYRVQFDSEHDVTKLPGWEGVSPTLHDRILTIAMQFVERYAPRPLEWIGTDHFNRFDWAGYQALELLWRYDQPRFRSISSPTVAKWAAVVAAFPTYGGADSEAQERILEVSDRVAPETVASTIARLIESATEDHRAISIVHLTRFCTSAALHDLYLHYLDDSSRSSFVFGAVLEWLLTHGNDEAEAKAKELVTRTNLPSEIGDLQVAAAIKLVTLVEGGGWDAVWTAIQRDSSFGMLLVERLAWRDDFASQVSRNLSDGAMADLYVWTSRRYPHEEDPPPPNGPISSRQSIATWRDSLLSALRSRATAAACSAIASVAASLPQLDWLNSVYLACQEDVRRLTWSPTSLERVIAVLESAERAKMAMQSGELSTRLFVVHGHDVHTLREVVHFLRRNMQFPDPVILSETPSFGRTIIEKFEDTVGDVQGAVVILTPDDKTEDTDSEEGKWRARQNVIFELGFFYAKFGRKNGRVLVLHKGKLEIPSDISGIIYINISQGVDAAGERIRRELSWAS